MHVQSGTLLWADAFENFRTLDPPCFFTAPELGWQAALKKAKVKLDLLTDIDMLLIVKKGVIGGICHTIYWYVKANNKYLKNYDKKQESTYLNYWDVNNLCGRAMYQKLPPGDFKWVEETSEFNEDKWWMILSWSWFSISRRVAWTF